MSMTLAARPTTYNGIAMRSRLEARFAAFLDRAGFAWEYEPRAFASERGQYLPDFRVISADGGRDLYVEVKGAEPSDDEAARLMRRMEIIFASLPEVSLGVVVGERAQYEIGRGFALGMFKGGPYGPWRPGGFCLCSEGHVSVYYRVRETPILWCQPLTGPLDDLRAYVNPFRQT